MTVFLLLRAWLCFHVCCVSTFGFKCNSVTRPILVLVAVIILEHVFVVLVAAIVAHAHVSVSVRVLV